MDMAQYLAAGEFVDSDAPQVVAFAKDATQGESDADAAVLRLYAAVRDGIIYDPYVSLADPANYRASSVLARRARLLHRQVGAAGGGRARDRRAGARRLCRRAQSSHLAAALRHGQDRHVHVALLHRALSVGALGQGDARFRPRAVRAHRPQAARLRRRRRIRCFSRSIRPAGGTWNICATAARLPTCRSTSFSADFIANYPSLMGSEGLAGDFHAEAVAEVLAEPTAGQS